MTEEARIDFRIPAENMNKLTRAIEKLNKRAKKIGAEPISLTEMGREEVIDKSDDLAKVYVFYLVRIDGEAPKINGWTFTASLDFLGEDVVIRAAPGEDVPRKYRDTTPVCEHCGLPRQRNTCYVLRHEDGRYKQVGSTCLGDFLGHPDPKALAAWAELRLIARELCEEAEDFGEGSGFVYIEDYLTHVALAIRLYGWMSKTKAEEGGPSSASNAYFLMSRAGREAGHPEEQDEKLALTALQWARDLQAEETEANDYLYNLHTVCKSEAVHPRHSGLVASAIAAHKRAVEKEIERKEAARSEWVGNVGTRVTTLVTITMAGFEMESRFGITYLYRMVDGEGNILVWFSSREMEEIEAGDRVKLTGTIKRHDTYRDTKQTIITRCKMAKIMAQEATLCFSEISA